MSTAFTQPPQPTIEYPDDDGQPMSDNTLQFKWIVLIKECLETLFRHDPNVFVAGDLLWYPEEGNPKVRQAPDAMVVLGRPKGYRGSYKQWEEGGLAPQVVFEILSPGNRYPQMQLKFQFYEKYGVEEYYLYDPESGSLEGWLREGGRLVAIDDMSGHVSPRLGIRFEPGEGPDSLRIFGPDGQPFFTHQQMAEHAEAEHQRRGRTSARRSPGGQAPRAGCGPRVISLKPRRACHDGSRCDPEAFRHVVPGPGLPGRSAPAADRRGPTADSRPACAPRRCQRDRRLACELPGPDQWGLPPGQRDEGQRPALRPVPGPRRRRDAAGDRGRR